jgi:hypothetical protein
MKLYKLSSPTAHISEPYVVGFRAAMDTAHAIASDQHASVTVRNECDMHTWTVAFRVRMTRALGPITCTETSR